MCIFVPSIYAMVTIKQIKIKVWMLILCYFRALVKQDKKKIL